MQFEEWATVEASELTTAQNAGETETDTTTIDTKEEPATVVATPVVDEARCSRNTNFIEKIQKELKEMKGE